VAQWLGQRVGYETKRSAVQFPATALPGSNFGQVVHMFILTCLCRCKCLVVSVDSQKLQLDSQCRSFASNLEQAANLVCAQANSASYPL